MEARAVGPALVRVSPAMHGVFADLLVAKQETPSQMRLGLARDEMRHVMRTQVARGHHFLEFLDEKRRRLRGRRLSAVPRQNNNNQNPQGWNEVPTEVHGFVSNPWYWMGWVGGGGGGGPMKFFLPKSDEKNRDLDIFGILKMSKNGFIQESFGIATFSETGVTESGGFLGERTQKTPY